MLIEDKIRLVRLDKIDDTNVSLLEGPLKPEVAELDPMGSSMMRVGVGVEDRMIYLIEYIDNEGKKLVSEKYFDYKFGVPLSDSEFEFTPPPDTQVIDLSEGSKDVVNHGGGLKSFTVTIEGKGPPEKKE